MEVPVHLRIHAKNIALSEALRAHVERHVQFSLSRFGDRIGRVSVHLEDDSRDDGDDKTCRIEVCLRPRRNVVVVDTRADLHAAIDRASERVGSAIGRAIEIDRMVESPTSNKREGTPR